MKRLIISEAQLEVVRTYELNESDHSIIVKKIVDDLNLNYEPIVGTYRKGGEYFEKPIIKIKADNDKISPKDLLYYLKFKNKNLNIEFLKQVILDWVNNDIKDYSLTKNISVS